MKFTEKQLQSFAAPLSDTEAERCKNAIRMVSDALKLMDYSDEGKEIRLYEADTWAYALNMQRGSRTISILIQGSYANNTNIRTQSDVDVAVILEIPFESKFREGVTYGDYNFSFDSYTIQEFKNELEYALRNKFKVGVERHDKSIRVTGNSYRVDADVVPAYRYRDYSQDYDFNQDNFIGGIDIRPDSGGRIINYPEQHILNGKKKNIDTNHSFKKCVRVIKNIKEIMIENGYSTALKVSSFQLESLIWNIPNTTYKTYSAYLIFIFSKVLEYLRSHINSFNNYYEVNEIKKLFIDIDTLTLYQNFVTDISKFYEYEV